MNDEAKIGIAICAAVVLIVLIVVVGYQVNAWIKGHVPYPSEDLGFQVIIEAPPGYACSAVSVDPYTVRCTR